MPYTLLYLFIFGFALGIGIHQQIEPLLLTISSLAALSLLWSKLEKLKGLLMLTSICIGCLIGYQRTAIFINHPANHTNNLTDNYQELVGKICGEPDQRRSHIFYHFCPDNYQGKILIKTTKQSIFNYQDTIKFKGKIATPQPIEDFAYDKYLARFQVYKISNNPQITRLNSDKSPIGYIYEFKTNFLEQINTQYPEPHAGLIAGLLIGYRGGLNEKLLTDFQNTGLTHIIAVSGANIALVVILLERFLFWVPRNLRLPFILLGICCYTILTGASASVIRAALTGGLATYARYTNKNQLALHLSIIVFFGMLLVNPLQLTADAGFQLSYLAVAGILIIQPRLNKLLPKPKSQLNQAITTTLAAQITTFPLVTSQFQIIPLQAVIANSLITPIIPLISSLSFVSLISIPIISPILIWLTIVLSTLLLNLTSWCAQISFLVLNPKPETAHIVGYISLTILLAGLVRLQFLNSGSNRRM